MTPYNGYKSERTYRSRQLPPGGYVLKITDAEIERMSWGNRLLVSFDINEGDEVGFFTGQYLNSTYENKRWKGVYRLTVPKDPGECRNERDKNINDSNVRKFNNFIACVEDSNPPYQWDWDESTLKGKLFGGLFRRREWEAGKWCTEVIAALTADEIRDGKFTVPNDKPLESNASAFDEAAAPAPAAEFDTEFTDDDLPF